VLLIAPGSSLSTRSGVQTTCKVKPGMEGRNGASVSRTDLAWMHSHLPAAQPQSICFGDLTMRKTVHCDQELNQPARAGEEVNIYTALGLVELHAAFIGHHPLQQRQMYYMTLIHSPSTIGTALCPSVHCAVPRPSCAPQRVQVWVGGQTAGALVVLTLKPCTQVTVHDTI
jgi:hypothetical protein